jgi:hypothetical protein
MLVNSDPLVVRKAIGVIHNESEKGKVILAQAMKACSSTHS